MAKGKKRARKVPVESKVAAPDERPPNPASEEMPVVAPPKPPTEPTFEKEIDAVLEGIRTDLHMKMARLGVDDLLQPKAARVFSRVGVDAAEQVAVRVDTMLFELASTGAEASVEAVDALMAELCLLRIAVGRKKRLPPSWLGSAWMTAAMGLTAFPLMWSIMQAKKTEK